MEDPKSTAIWELLQRDRSLAKSVRVLELESLSPNDPRTRIPLISTSERPDNHPPILSPKAAVAATKVKPKRQEPQNFPYPFPPQNSPETTRNNRVLREYFVGALRNMERLSEFKWKTPRIDFGKDEAELVWEALSGQQCLRKLNVRIWWPCQNLQDAFSKVRSLYSTRSRPDCVR